MELGLSENQKGIWLAHKESAQHFTFNIPLIIQLPAEADIHALKMAVQALVDEHEALRSVYRVDGNAIKQSILDDYQINIEEIKHQTLKSSDINNVLKTESYQYIDIEKTVLLAKIIEINPNHNLLLLVIHHIAVDMISLATIYKSLAINYLHNIGYPLSNPVSNNLQYSDYLHWQATYLNTDQASKHHNDLIKRLNLKQAPCLQYKPKIDESVLGGSDYYFEICAKESNRILQYSIENKVTQQPVFLSVFHLLISRYLEQNNTTILIPTNNRLSHTYKKTVGFFTNLYPTKSEIENKTSFQDLLEYIKNQVEKSYADQHYPFSRLLTSLDGSNDRDKNSVLSYAFNYQSFTINEWFDLAIHEYANQLNWKIMQPTWLNSDLSLSDSYQNNLRLTVNKQENGFKCFFQYNKNVYTESFIRQLAKHYLNLLNSVISNPHCRITIIPMLSCVEVNQILNKWNKPISLINNNDVIKRHYETSDQYANFPAIYHNGKTITYEKLSYYSDCLYQDILKIFEKDNIIVICYMRSIELIVALYAVLKSGKAFLMLDLTLPKGRINQILDSLNSDAILIDENLVYIAKAKIENFTNYHLFVKKFIQIAKENKINITKQDRPLINNKSRAYLIYTSGTTGKPKGINILHCSLENLVADLKLKWNIKGGSRSLQFSSQTFDAFISEVFVTLSSGSTLYILDEEYKRDPNLCINYLTKKSINIATIPPVMLSMFPQEDSLPNLKTLIVAGEVCSKKAMDYWSNGRLLINGYGPAEATVCSVLSYHDSSKYSTEIGSPICNTIAYVFDKYLNHMPSGVAGELYIGGIGLADSYYGEDEVSDSFVNYISSPNETIRLYKTGDHVCWTEKGTLNYIGRKDQQIQVQGVRVELQEIEKAIIENNYVLQCAVFTIEINGDNHIVAYYSCKNHEEDSEKKMRRYLLGVLPHYMVPPDLIAVDSLPITHNGKINISVLKRSYQKRLMKKNLEKITSDFEMRIADVWKFILNLEYITYNTNFFSVGGNSLSATLLVQKISEKFKINLLANEIYQYPLFSDFIDFIKTNSRQLSVKERYKKRQDEELYVLSYSQLGIWLAEKNSAGINRYTLPVLLEVNVDLNIQILQKTFDMLVEQYESIRTIFPVIEGRVFQQVLRYLNVAIETVPLESMQILPHIRSHMNKAFCLESGPLISVQVLDFKSRKYIYITMHHIIADGISISLLVRKLNTVYGLILSENCNGSSIPEELTHSPIDFAYEEKLWLKTKEAKSSIGYWKKILNDYMPIKLELAKYPINNGKKTTGYVSVELDKDLNISIDFLCRKLAIPKFIFMLSAFSILLSRHMLSDDVSFAVPVSRRNSVEYQNAFGLFLNTLIYRIDISQHSTFEDLTLAWMKISETNLNHQNVPIEYIFNEILKKNPHQAKINILFNYFDDMVVNSDDLCFFSKSPELDHSVINSKFDLTLYVENKETIDSFKLVFNQNIYDEKFCYVLLKQYKYLLEQITNNSQISLSNYSLNMTDLSLYHNTCSNIHSNSFPGLIEKIVHNAIKYPHSIAVEDDISKLSYGELWSKVEQFSFYLQRYPIKPYCRIALFIPKSVDLIIALIAILINRCAFMMLDGSLPEKRIQTMLSNAGIDAVISDTKLSEECLPKTCKLIRLHTGFAVRKSESFDMLSNYNEVTLTDPAYIFFTSGSTGEPKAVVGTHGGLSHFIHWQSSQFSVCQNDKVALITSLSFDVVLRDIFLPLWSGGTLMIPPKDIRPGTLQLLDWLDKQKITILHLVPSLTALWLSNASENSLQQVRLVFFAGELLTRKLIESWRNKFELNRARFINLYGPTETTLAKLYYEVERDDYESFPVGKPISETYAVVANDCSLCGIGEVGDVFIETHYITAGYIIKGKIHPHNLRKFTISGKERFGYQTGDIGFIDCNGKLFIVGRKDHQIKISGVRIDPHEISRAINAYQNIKDSIIVKQQFDNKDVLLAYLVIATSSYLDVDKLKQYLGYQLPAIMIPSRYIILTKLPINSHGKLDYPNLEKFKITQYSKKAEENDKLSDDPLSKYLESLFKNVLNITKLDANADLFMLGGNSIIAAEILAKINNEIEASLTLTDLFSHSSINKLMKLIRSNSTNKKNTPIVDKQINLKQKFELTVEQKNIFLQFYMNKRVKSDFNIPLLLGVDEILDLKILQKSISYLVKKYPLMRITFSKNSAGKVVQYITDEECLLDYIETTEKEFAGIVKQLIQHEFDIYKAPLIRFYILRISKNKNFLLINSHHILFDGTSMKLLARTLLNQYCLLLKDRILNVVPDIGFFQYLNEIQEHNYNNNYYWESYLDGAKTLSLTTDSLKEASDNPLGASYYFEFSSQLKDRITQLSMKNNTTNFNVMLSAFLVMLFRYENESDITICIPFNDRCNENHINSVGLFIKTLPIRNKVDAQKTFLDLLKEVSKNTINSYINIDSLRTNRKISIKPFNNVMFNYQYIEVDDEDKLTFNMPNIDYEVAKGDLILSMLEKDSKCSARFEYNKSLFSPENIQYKALVLTTIIRTILKNPLIKIKDIPLLDNEKLTQFSKVNSRLNYFAQPKLNIISRFRKMVSKYPKNIAIQNCSKSYSYSELETVTNNIALILLSKPCHCAENLIVISLKDSIKAVISMLSVLKAGMGYVPIDNDYPAGRIEYIIQKSKPNLIITDQSLTPQLNNKFHNIILYFDSLYQDAKKEDGRYPNLDLLPSNIAYVIFTSGTTGNPKGVVCEHQGVVRLVVDTNYIHFNSNDNILNTSSLSFDAATFEIWGALLNGACLCFMENRQDLLDIENFRTAISNFAISIIWLTTRQFERYALSDPSVFDSLNYLIFGGEDSGSNLTHILNNIKPKHCLFGYGPTENTTFSTVYSIEPATVKYLAKVPIGTAINGTNVYLLDQYMNAVPPGCQGQIYLAGLGLARGYLDDPELTQSSFIEHNGEKLYATGDIAKLLTDGSIEFVGRNDDQIKLRGYRIELEEIRFACNQLNYVSDTVILARKFNDQTAIYAYCTLGDDCIINEDDVHRDIRKALPSYMLPKRIIILENFPMTLHGKLDRNALLNVDTQVEAKDTPIIEPTEKEKILIRVFSSVLGKEDVTVNANFFSNGGDSILIIELISIASNLGLEITPRLVFEFPTVYELAKQVEFKQSININNIIDGELELSPIQQWFVSQNLEYLHYWNQSQLLILNKPLEIKVIKDIFDAIVSKYDVFSLRYDEKNKLQHYENNNAILFHSIELSTIADSEKLDHLKNEHIKWQSQLNLSKGPVIHIAIVDGLYAQRRCLLVSIHHWVIDSVSWRLLLNDFSQMYHLTNSSMIDSHSITNKYTFHSWVKESIHYSETSECLATVDYWKNLPVEKFIADNLDIFNSTNPQEKSITKTISLAGEISNLLFDKYHSHKYVKIDHILLSAVVYTMSLCTSNETISLNLERHGREDILENINPATIVGWLTSIFPYSVKISDQINLKKLIKNVRRSLLSIPLNGFTYSILSHYSRLVKDKEHLQNKLLSNISFNYLGILSTKSYDSSILELSEYQDFETIHPENKFYDDINLNFYFLNSTLYIKCRANGTVSEKFLSKFLQLVSSSLEKILNYKQLNSSELLVPEDFPNLELSDSNLEEILKKFSNLESIYPLSGLQSSLLFESEYSTSGVKNIVNTSWECKGVLKLDDIQRAFDYLIHKYAILRNAFIWENVKQPLQILTHVKKNAITYIDMSNNSDKFQSLRGQLTNSEKIRCSDLSCGALIRLTVVKKNDNNWYFLLTYHHIILDGWSISIIISEFKRFLENKNDDILPTEEVLPFSTYVEHLRKLDKSAAKEFFSRMLTLESPKDVLPKNIKKQNKAAKISTLACHIDRLVLQQIRHLSQKYALTINSIVQFTWTYVLSKYARSTSVTYGTVVSGRAIPVPGITELVGLAINAIPISVNIDYNRSVIENIKALQTIVSHLNNNFHLSKTDLHSLLPDDQMIDLFDILYVFENYPIKNTESNKIHFSNFKTIEKDNIPLKCIAGIENGEILIRFIYHNAIYEKSVIQGLLRHFEHALTTITNNIENKVMFLTMIPQREQRFLLKQSRVSKIVERRSTTFLDFISKAICKFSSRPAVIVDDSSLSYTELNVLSNRIAAFLIENDIQKGDFVGIYLETTPIWIAVMLGIMKAGAVFIPADINHPEKRIQHMFNHAETRLVITQNSLADRILPGKIQLICIDDIDITTNRENVFDTNIYSEDKIYVIYTSGSTGQPKGALNYYEGVTNLVECYSQYIKRDDKVFVFTSLGFDLTYKNIFTALSVGAELHLSSKSSYDPEYLRNIFDTHKITFTNCTPSGFTPLLDKDLMVFKSLRYLNLGGEAFQSSPLHQFVTTHVHCKYINSYGPTECSDLATIYEVPRTDIINNYPIPLGHALSQVELYVLDSEGMLVPNNVPGELYIGGISVGGGYINADDLTNKYFIDNPYGAGKLYKTGDLVSRDHFACLQYLGRMDHQVKLYGNRIETIEIEKTMRDIDGITDCVVTLKSYKDRPTLIAYYISNELNEFSSEKVKVILSRYLPSYMIPHYILKLDAFPLNSNGKLARDHLPLPKIDTKPNLKDSKNLTKFENVLLTVWKHVLDNDHITMTDNFFALGGDSIMSIQISSKLREIGYEISPADIVEYPKIHLLAQYCEKKLEDEVINIDSKGEIPLFPIQEWFFKQCFANPNHYNQSLLLRSEEGVLEFNKLNDVLNRLVEHHPILQAKFSYIDGIWKQHYSKLERRQYITTVSDSGLPPDEIEKHLQQTIFNLQTSLDIKSGKLFSAVLYNSYHRKYQLLLTVVHHLVVDKVSWNIILDDLTNAYNEKNIVLPKHTVSYKSCSQTLLKDDYKNLFSIYLEKNRHLIKFTEYNCDLYRRFVGKDYTHKNFCKNHYMLDKLHSDEVMQFARSMDAKLNEIILIALSFSLFENFGFQELLTEIESHGRTFIGSKENASRTIGWFTAKYPVKLIYPKFLNRQNIRKSDVEEMLTNIRQQTHLLEKNEHAFSLVRYYSEDKLLSNNLEKYVTPIISLNYLGNIRNSDSKLWKEINYQIGDDVSDKNESSLALDINAYVVQGCLHINCMHNQNLFDNELTVNLAEGIANSLQDIVSVALVECIEEF